MTPQDRSTLLTQIAAISESDMILHFKECESQDDIINNLKNLNHLLYKFVLNYLGTLELEQITALLAHKLSADIGTMIMTDEDFLSFLKSHDIMVESKE